MDSHDTWANKRHPTPMTYEISSKLPLGLQPGFDTNLLQQIDLSRRQIRWRHNIDWDLMWPKSLRWR